MRNKGSFSQAYRAAAKLTSGCPIEAGVLGHLVDNECCHGRLPGYQGDACDCWKTNA